MADCNKTVDLIYDSENIGDSLTKINNNFSSLKTLACNIEGVLDKTIEVRTFFYYGPNSATAGEVPADPTSGMQDGVASRPSNSTIKSFVTDTDKLNLPAISESGDTAYVIYQKTGWQSQNVVTSRSGSGSVPYQRTETVPVLRKIGINWGKGYYYWTTEQRTVTYYAGYSWSTNINDQYKLYAPVFIIWKLTFDGTEYNIDSNYPKFTRASTNSTSNWNNPTAWSIY